MSDRRRWGILLGLVMLGAPLRAQELAQLARREAELRVRLDSLKASVAVGDSMRFAGQRRAVVSAGEFHVAYPEWVVRETRVDLPVLMSSWRARYGRIVDSLLRDTLFIGADDSVHARRAGWVELEWRMGPLHDSASVPLVGEMRGEWPAWIVSVALRRWAASLIDLRFARWLGESDPSLSLDLQREGAVRGLMLSPSSRGRRCLEGDIEECALLLELRDLPDPVLQGYDPADLPGLVARMFIRSIPERSRCVTGRDLATCAEILGAPTRRPARAASPAIRQSLFAFAVMRGGEMAWMRLKQAAGRPVADQLAAVAGEPIDSLLGAWQRDLREGRRTSAADIGPILLMALAWAVAGSLFFAWRYRWRHV